MGWAPRTARMDSFAASPNVWYCLLEAGGNRAADGFGGRASQHG